MTIANESSSDWLATDHKRVYYRSMADQWNRGEAELARAVAEQFDEWTVVITMGPYRPHELAHELIQDDQVIHLDCYAAGMVVYGPDIEHRPQHPAIEHGPDLIRDIAQDIKNVESEPDSSQA